MTTKRTVLVDGRAFSLQKKGGVSQLWAKILQTQAWRRSLKTALFLYPGWENNVHLQELLPLASREHVRIIESPVPPSDDPRFNGAGAAERRRRILREHLKDKVHAVFNTYYGENIWPDCSRYVVVGYDCAHEEVTELQIKETTNGVLQRKRQAFEEASIIMCISDFTRAKSQDYYGSYTSAALRVVHLGHDSDVPAVRKVSGLLVHIGNRGAYKNFGILLSSIEQLLTERACVSFLVLGGEPEETGLRDAMAKFAGRVLWVPDPTDAEVNLAMALAEVYVSASRYEGFGLPLLNALRLGTKPAVSAIPPYEEIAKSDAFYFDPLSEKSVMETIVAALDSKKRPSGHWRTWEEVAKDYVTTVE